VTRDGRPIGPVALVLGATGLVGSELVERLLADGRHALVRVLVRRSTGRRHPRLEERVVDFERLAEAEAIAADEVFCCLGTTLRAAGSREAFRRVDHDYVAEAARLAKEGGARRFLLVTSSGASENSPFFYSRVKAEVEESVRAVGFDTVWFVRPSLLLGAREERRPFERLAQRLGRPLGRLLVGPLRRYRPVEAREVAAALARLAERGGRGGVVESEEIGVLAGGEV
jgi:uncharacterized protein YbjT (DUF2867 family)